MADAAASMSANEAGAEAPVSQFDKDDVELVGLVKFDFLGLTTLTVIQNALDLAVAQRAATAEADG